MSLRQVDVLKLLLDSMASPALRNENGPRWTALHAAALQEEGKACMLLLEYRADPMETDREGGLGTSQGPCSTSKQMWRVDFKPFARHHQ